MDKNQIISTYYSQHRDELLAFVSSRLGVAYVQQHPSPLTQEAEDIVQNVFLRILGSDKMLSPVTLPALVHTIARNLVNDYYRRRAFRHEYEHFLVSSGGASSSMESVFFAADIVERMERGLARLPQNCREIYRMHILGGMRVSEISTELGENYKAVENRLGLARRQMRQYLKAVI